MSDDQSAKVIRFPGKQKEVSQNEAPPTREPDGEPTLPRGRANLSSGLSLFAIILATVAVNRFALRAGDVRSGRGLASANLHLDRDAAWEKSLAERLSKPGALAGAAATGRGATLAEQLRFATLEDKYAIDWRPDRVTLAGVRAQGRPLVLDRASFLEKYGQLFDTSFAGATLAERAVADGHAIEIYELRDAGGRTRARVRFELDADQGLLALAAVQK